MSASTICLPLAAAVAAPTTEMCGGHGSGGAENARQASASTPPPVRDDGKAEPDARAGR